MPDVTERAVTAVTMVSVTSFLPGPMRSLTSDGVQARFTLVSELLMPELFKGLVGLLLRADFPKQRFPVSCVFFFPKRLNTSSFAEGLSTHVGQLVATNVITGYCVFEKKKNREIKNPKQIKMKNGRAAIRGTCGSCGKPIFRIGAIKPASKK
jgi:hypothetical protein